MDSSSMEVSISSDDLPRVVTFSRPLACYFLMLIIDSILADVCPKKMYVYWNKKPKD